MFKSRLISLISADDFEKLEKLLQEITAIVGDNIEVGKDLEVDGDLLINDLNNITDKDKNSLLNFKTLFGNKNILGNDNIDLYNHFITLNDTYYLNYISSNNLVCDSIQDFTALTKATKNTKIAVGSTYVIYTGSIWQTSSNINVTKVTDVVTSI